MVQAKVCNNQCIYEPLSSNSSVSRVRVRDNGQATVLADVAYITKELPACSSLSSAAATSELSPNAHQQTLSPAKQLDEGHRIRV